EVDTRGIGTLTAQWRIAAPENDLPLKSGLSQLTHTGPSPRGKPEVIATTLSELAADFSRELAQAIGQSLHPTPAISPSVSTHSATVDAQGRLSTRFHSRP